MPICDGEIKNEIPFTLTPCTNKLVKEVVISQSIRGKLKSLDDGFSYNFWGSNGIVYLSVSWRIKSMTLVFQLTVFALIATSSILLISVPVVFASPDG